MDVLPTSQLEKPSCIHSCMPGKAWPLDGHLCFVRTANVCLFVQVVTGICLDPVVVLCHTGLRRGTKSRPDIPYRIQSSRGHAGRRDVGLHRVLDMQILSFIINNWRTFEFHWLLVIGLLLLPSSLAEAALLVLILEGVGLGVFGTDKSDL